MGKIIFRNSDWTAASAKKTRAWFLTDKGNLDASGLYAFGDSQSFVLKFAYVNRWAKSHTMLATFANTIVKLAEDVGSVKEPAGIRKRGHIYRFCGRMRLQGSECSKCFIRLIKEKAQSHRL